MQYRPFGKTGATVSALGFGAMRLPMTPDGQHVDEEQAIPALRRAFELGVTFFDTAPYYCNKESEAVVGKAIKPFRDRISLSTKNDVADASGARWRGQLEESLRRLDTDHIDFYHMWGISWKQYQERIELSEPLAMARRAKREGLIRHLSFSFHDNPDALIRLIDTGHFESMIVQYNLLDRANERGIAHARERGLGVGIMGPLGGGRLAAFSPEINRLVPGGARSTPELALRFVLSNPDVSVALSGMNSVQMVEENAATASRLEPLSPEELALMAMALDEIRGLADLYCTGCGYCLPCPHEVNIPKNFEYMNYARLYGLKGFARQAYARIGKPGSWVNGKTAAECVECGECEPKCPQKIPIISQLREVARELG